MRVERFKHLPAINQTLREFAPTVQTVPLYKDMVLGVVHADEGTAIIFGDPQMLRALSTAEHVIVQTFQSVAPRLPITAEVVGIYFKQGQNVSSIGACFLL